MKLITKLGIGTLGYVVLLAVAPAQNTQPSPQQQAAEAVRFRRADMDMQAYSLAPLLPMLEGGRFDEAVVLKAASQLATLMEMLPDMFETDTSKFSLKTNARPLIWTDPLAFELQIRDMQDSVDNMAAAVMKGDEPAMLKTSRTVVQACRGCHEKFAIGLK